MSWYSLVHTAEYVLFQPKHKAMLHRNNKARRNKCQCETFQSKLSFCHTRQAFLWASIHHHRSRSHHAQFRVVVIWWWWVCVCVTWELMQSQRMIQRIDIYNLWMLVLGITFANPIPKLSFSGCGRTVEMCMGHTSSPLRCVHATTIHKRLVGKSLKSSKIAHYSMFVAFKYSIHLYMFLIVQTASSFAESLNVFFFL